MPNSCQFRATSNPILKRGRARKIRKKVAPCGHRVPLVNPRPRAFATTFRKIYQRRTVNARVGSSIELKSGSRRVRPVSPPPPRIVLDNFSRRIPKPIRFGNVSRRISETNRLGNVGGWQFRGAGRKHFSGRKVVPAREGDKLRAPVTGR